MHWLLSGKMNPPPMLKQLHALAEQEAQRSNRSVMDAFEPIGLLLFEELDDIDYDSTPMNVSSFATTGGDGVHYSLLHIDGKVADESPVVMTVPMMFDRPNLIVGETLHDFLCLGCEVGYFWLEQLTYDRAETIEKVLHPEQVFASNYGEDYANHPDFREEMNLLNLLKNEFNLSPWVELGAHLDDLQARYMPLLELPRLH